MHEILFKAKRVDTGEWVEGYYIHVPIGRYKKDEHLIQPICNDGRPHTLREVIPETVSQYTGLEDKNGIKIFEGDICNCREYECFGKIIYNEDEAGFYFDVMYEDGGFGEERLYDYNDELEVIGNIFDNPELLESEEK